jgi:hypothetical protein
VKHCLECEVQWAPSTGHECWCCGRPGQDGWLPARFVSHNALELWLRIKGAA